MFHRYHITKSPTKHIAYANKAVGGVERQHLPAFARVNHQRAEALADAVEARRVHRNRQLQELVREDQRRVRQQRDPASAWNSGGQVDSDYSSTS